jgi:predicted enzyme related to lactoylglutathione lyase
MSKIPSGQIIWHELHTSDPKRAIAFYSELFGWKSREMDMGPGGVYTLFSAGPKDVAGGMKLDARSGAPSHWLPYFETPAVDADSTKAEKLGAKVVVPPLDIPNIGRFAVLTDPQGAALALMTSANQDWADSTPKTGEFCWDEVIVKDPKAAVTFYTSLFPWKSEPMDMGPMGTYYLMKNGEKTAAGSMAPQDAGTPPAWLAYVAVDDVDASTKRAEKLGATVIAKPADIPNIGRFSIFSDPTGAVLCFFKGA